MNSKLSNIVTLLDLVDKKILTVEKIMIYILMFVMVSLAFFSVITRILFNTSFVGCIDIVQIMVLWCTFIGGAIGARNNQHLNINILQQFIKEGAFKHILEIVLFLVTAIVAGFLAYSGYCFVESQMEFGEDLPSLGLKLWPFQVILPYTFTIVTFRYFVGMLKKIFHMEEEKKQMIV